MKLYKIRDKETGLFSLGGCCTPLIKWNKKGKVWHGLGAVKLHIRQHCKPMSESHPLPYKRWEENRIPHSWEILEVEIDWDNPDNIINAHNVYPEVIDVYPAQ